MVAPLMINLNEMIKNKLFLFCLPVVLLLSACGGGKSGKAVDFSTVNYNTLVEAVDVSTRESMVQSLQEAGFVFVTIDGLDQCYARQNDSIEESIVFKAKKDEVFNIEYKRVPINGGNATKEWLSAQMRQLEHAGVGKFGGSMTGDYKEYGDMDAFIQDFEVRWDKTRSDETFNAIPIYYSNETYYSIVYQRRCSYYYTKKKTECEEYVEFILRKLPEINK